MFHGYLGLYYMISRRKHQDEQLVNVQFGILYNLYLNKSMSSLVFILLTLSPGVWGFWHSLNYFTGSTPFNITFWTFLSKPNILSSQKYLPRKKNQKDIFTIHVVFWISRYINRTSCEKFFWINIIYISKCEGVVNNTELHKSTDKMIFKLFPL